MKKILIPYNFSKPALHALKFALSVAEQSKGTISLVNVIELPVMSDPLLIPMVNYEDSFKKEMKEKASDELERIIEKYNTENALIIPVVLFGNPVRTILDYIKAEHFDLVIMGSHGATGLRANVIGSNAEKIVRRSVVPVLIVKNFYKGPIKNIVFPATHETVNQEDLIEKIKALQTFFKAHLHIVWINTPLNFTSDTASYEWLHDFVKHAGLVECSAHIFNHHNEEDGIIEFTKLIDGDLIAIGTHGRKGISHLLNGSVAEDIVNRTEGLIWTYTMKDVHEAV